MQLSVRTIRIVCVVMSAMVLLQTSCGYSEYKVSILSPSRQANPARQETQVAHDRFAKQMAQTA
ncbi:MAG: hypothetical protein R3C28_29135 [Pirellulaceae bacterium]